MLYVNVICVATRICVPNCIPHPPSTFANKRGENRFETPTTALENEPSILYIVSP